MAITATLESINSGGIVSLSDGSRWRLPPLGRDPQIARSWPKGAQISIEEKPGSGHGFPWMLRYDETGEHVSATRVPGMTGGLGSLLGGSQ